MRSILYIVTSLVVIGLAFWAYRENYETQSAMTEARKLQREITTARERLRILNAEWAYLNRPERLRELAEMNFSRLGLLPLQSHQFSHLEQVPYPPEEVAVAISATNASEEATQ